MSKRERQADRQIEEEKSHLFYFCSSTIDDVEKKKSENFHSKKENRIEKLSAREKEKVFQLYRYSLRVPQLFYTLSAAGNFSAKKRILNFYHTLNYN